MAQLSTTMSQAQRATAFHFFTSNHFLSLQTVPDPLGCSESLSTSILGLQLFSNSGNPNYSQYKQVVCSSQELRHYPSMLSICISKKKKTIPEFNSDQIKDFLLPVSGYKDENGSFLVPVIYIIYIYYSGNLAQKISVTCRAALGV